MAISSNDRRTKNVQVFVEKDAVETSFAKCKVKDRVTGKEPGDDR